MRQKAKTPDRKTEQIVLGPPEAFPDLRGSARERARFELAWRLGETGLASTGTPSPAGERTAPVLAGYRRPTPEKTPAARGDRLIDAIIVWITPDRPLEPGINRFEVRVSEAGDTWIERLQW